MWCDYFQDSHLWNRNTAANFQELRLRNRNTAANETATACAILDSLRAVHDDDEEESLHREVRKAEKRGMAHVRKHYKHLLVDVGFGRGGKLRSSCVE
mmetsp:Transcript_73685/g.170877  ORF Transcript_73685/g.170877 Transcript_73685/m.170877 type:complete len:98 (-) Transcript_73685:40-333(-)